MSLIAALIAFSLIVAVIIGWTEGGDKPGVPITDDTVIPVAEFTVAKASKDA